MLNNPLHRFHRLIVVTAVWVAAGMLVLGPLAAQARDTVRLATTTSTENTGLLSDLLPRFQADTGYAVHVIAVGTGKALRMGRDGDVDVVLVHAPEAERRFVEQGFGVARYPVMYNDFVLVGPASDPAGLHAARSIEQALAAIARTQAVFVSRGDDSGTHKKERRLWRAAAVHPRGAWYREAGQGMGKVLQMADELQGYALTDRGTWLAMRALSNLKIVFAGGAALFNPYGIIRVSERRHPALNHAGAQALIEWLVSPVAQRHIAAFSRHGEVLFVPHANIGAR